MKAIHPTLDVPTLTVSDLLARADEASTRVLEGALRLAVARRDLSNEMARVHSLLASHPNTQMHRGPVAEPHELTATDMARSLALYAPSTIASLFPDGLSDEWHQLGARWSPHLKGVSAGATPSTLAPSWARRWLFAEVGGPRPISTATLLASVGEEGLESLAAFDAVFAQEAITLGEAVSKLWGAQRWFTRSPPAYFDRDEMFAALLQAVDEKPGVVLLGEPRSGRTALLEAFALHVSRSDALRARWGAISINHFNDFRHADTYAWDEDRHLFGLTPSARHPDLRSGGAEPFWPTMVDLLRRVAGSARKKVVLVATPEEWRALCAQVPRCEAFQVLMVSSIEDQDWLPIWMCHAYADGTVSLATTLAVLSQLAPMGQATNLRELEPWNLRGSLPMHPWWRFEPSAVTMAKPSGFLRKVLKTRDFNVRGEQRREQAVRWLGGPERVDTLLALEAKLNGA